MPGHKLLVVLGCGLRILGLHANRVRVAQLALVPALRVAAPALFCRELFLLRALGSRCVDLLGGCRDGCCNGRFGNRFGDRIHDRCRFFFHDALNRHCNNWCRGSRPYSCCFRCNLQVPHLSGLQEEDDGEHEEYEGEHDDAQRVEREELAVDDRASRRHIGDRDAVAVEHLLVEDVAVRAIDHERNRRGARAVEHGDRHLGGLAAVLLRVEEARTCGAAPHAAHGHAVHGHATRARDPRDRVVGRVDVAGVVDTRVEQEHDRVRARGAHVLAELVARERRGVDVVHAHVLEVLRGRDELRLVADARRGLVDDGGEARRVGMQAVGDLHDLAHVALLDHARRIAAVRDALRVRDVVDAEEDDGCRGEHRVVVLLDEAKRLVIAADHDVIATALRDLLPHPVCPGSVRGTLERRMIRVHVDDVDIDRRATKHVEHAIARELRSRVVLVV